VDEKRGKRAENLSFADLMDLSLGWNCFRVFLDRVNQTSSSVGACDDVHVETKLVRYLFGFWAYAGDMRAAGQI
jgi:hypothetical protein